MRDEFDRQSMIQNSIDCLRRDLPLIFPKYCPQLVNHVESQKMLQICIRMRQEKLQRVAAAAAAAAASASENNLPPSSSSSSSSSLSSGCAEEGEEPTSLIPTSLMDQPHGSAEHSKKLPLHDPNVSLDADAEEGSIPSSPAAGGNVSAASSQDDYNSSGLCSEKEHR